MSEAWTKLGSFSCPECGGQIDVQHDSLTGSSFLDYRDCQHDNPFVEEVRELLRFEGLDALSGFEAEARQHHLYDIGYHLLGAVGEANHSSWDGMTRAELEAWNMVLKDLTYELKNRRENPEMYAVEGGWGFGGAEFWDAKGERHVK